MVTTKITDKGQVTIPKEIREEFHLHSGDDAEFAVEGVKIILKKVRSKNRLMERCGIVQVTPEEYYRMVGEIRLKFY